MKRCLPHTLLALLVFTASLTEAAPREKPNILFIAVDDLRPELGCYGSKTVKSPNIDALAAVGRRFDRSYCQQAICSPSRASLLSGLRPDQTGITHNYVEFRDLNPDAVTLPQHFKRHGYETVSVGKVFHRAGDDPASWSRQPASPKVPYAKPTQAFADPANRELHRRQQQAMLEKYGPASKQGLASGPAYECYEAPDHAYLDGWNTEVAIATLKDLVARDDGKPFFLALGFKLPHLNWVAPKKYWDLYDREQMRLPAQTTGPQDGAQVGLHASFELRVRDLIPKEGPIDEDLARTLLHAYHACVSYVDANVGKMLAALDEAGVRDNTLIVLWGDHGWHLGEMGLWGKATNYEIATRTPLILSVPGMKQAGAGTRALVELVDLFPTLCDLASLPKPDRLAGTSLVPILEDPNAVVKDFALSQFPSPALREWAANPLSPAMRETFFGPLIEQVEGRIKAQVGATWDRELFENHLMGYSLRTDRHRYIEWTDSRNPTAPPVAVELYDHSTDPAETVNVAAGNPGIVRALSEKLRQIRNLP